MGVQQKSITALRRQSLDDVPSPSPVNRIWPARYLRMSARLEACCMREVKELRKTCRIVLLLLISSVFKFKTSSCPSSTDPESSSQPPTRLFYCLSQLGKMHAFVHLVLLGASTVLALNAAQNASAAALAAQIPACALPCDESGIRAVGCELKDYACHCAHGTELAASIPSCLQKNSTCSATDLQIFAAIPPKICAVVNGTASSSGSSGVSMKPTGSVGTGMNSTVTSTIGTSAQTTMTGTASNTGFATHTVSGPTRSSSGVSTTSATNAANGKGVYNCLLAIIGTTLLGVVL
ncbi:hypothetical protein BTJ68_00596 [Hortaea werneckii EXF-2000]|uniref:CFEM domain-containing protein n=2 Tax=Hortaea werneckii TaxID=91943 RepID=A0A3M7J329_HORWE|nr:hypothetical protein BTJ68_00596 [Hortaea werneckii EXF-2000]RMZ32002.1 hypothetical protein D0859_03890 [Hortaea werneckii]